MPFGINQIERRFQGKMLASDRKLEEIDNFKHRTCI